MFYDLQRYWKRFPVNVNIVMHMPIARKRLDKHVPMERDSW
jgi:hypothetical protein